MCVVVVCYYYYFVSFYDPPTFSNHTSFHKVAPTSYRFLCSFHVLFFAHVQLFISRWVLFLLHTMFLSFLASRIRHSFPHSCEKVFTGDLFSIFDNFSPLCAKKTTIASKHEDPDYGDLSMNQSRGAKIPFTGAKIPLTGAKISFMEINKLRVEGKKC